MRRRKLVIVAIVALIATAFIAWSCQGEPPEQWSLQKLLSEGRLALQEGNGSTAYNFYKDALQIDPDNLEAMWGVTVSTMDRIVSNLDGLVDLLAGVYIYEPTSQECVEACERLTECNLLDEIRSSEETCMQDCPWGLQPMMFADITASDDCDAVRHDAIEWILNTQPEDCEAIAGTLEMCGNFNPPITYDKQEFIERCPRMYVEHHSRCFTKHLGECNRKDRTCFEHTIVGFQVLFRELGTKMPPEILKYSDVLLEHPEQQLFLKNFWLEFHDPAVKWELPGRFGVPELYFSRAMAHFFNWFLFCATSTNLDINTVTFDLNVREAEGFEEMYWGLTTAVENMLYDPIFPNALIAYDDEKSLELIKASGPELGYAFGDFGRYLDYLMIDPERQTGKAMGYGDTNNNGIWDPEEYVEFKGLGITINRIQAEQIAAMCEGMELNLVYGTDYPFDVSLFRNVLDSYNLWYVDLICRLIFGDGYTNNDLVDFSHFFTDPNVYDFRDFALNLVEDLKLIGSMFFGGELDLKSAPVE
ncbi:MAG: hypothetical protein P9M14_06190 [Candidatus Alcyoniella australis]|nr:hypothetical protein [Candidatus Alcyoniella australis]